MARIPRLYRARRVSLDGTVEQRTYQTPKAAEERRERMAQADPRAIVTVTASHPVTFPHAAGDAQTFEIPDTTVSRSTVNDFLRQLGIEPAAVQAVTVGDDTLLVTYDEHHDKPAKRGKRAPRNWRVFIEEN